MTATIAILEALGSFLVGVAGRVGIFLAAALVLALPALIAALTWRALERRRRPGTELHADARLAPNHTWLAPRKDGTLEVGVDEVAERLLPSATAVELPRPGMVVHRGDPIAVIRAGKRAVRIGAPVDGTVTRVNRRLRGNPALVKAEPYGRGWLFELAPAGDDWRRLPEGLLADTWLLGEKRRLSRFLEDELGLAAADGGELVAPAPSLLGEEGWKKVVAAFLHAA
jgi:glycine cleavage system H lipoate-binding protein